MCVKILLCLFFNCCFGKRQQVFIFCFYNFKSGNTRLAFCSYSMRLCFLWRFFGDRSVIAIFRLLLCAFRSCRTVILCNFDTFREINLYPIITFSKFDLIKNAVVYASNTSEIAMFLAIFPKVNGRCERTYIRSVCLSLLTVCILLYFATAVMGKSAVIRNFPFYSFFQISKFGTFERLDVLHISFWIMGVFVKTVTALYCASSCISKKPKRSFVFASSLIVFVISILILKLSGGQGVNYEFTMILFFVFCVIIPLGTLVFKKKNYGDELVKAY